MKVRSVTCHRCSGSLVRRLSAALVLIVGVGTTLAVVLFASGVHRAEDAEVRRNVASSAQLMAELLAPSLWELDTERVAALAEALAQDPRVARITVRDSSAVVYEVRHGSADDVVAQRQLIMHGNRQLGELELVFSRALYEARAEQGAKQAAIIGALVLIVSLVGLRVLLARMLRHPLKKLTTTVQRYSNGDYARHGPTNHYAEFAPFWSVLETMASRIHDQIAELRETNVRLATEVTERRRAEENAWHSRNMLALVMNAVPQSIFWKDCNSVYLGGNAVFARWSGLAKPEDVVGMTDDDLPTGSNQAEARRRVDRAVIERATTLPPIIDQVTWPDGREGWVETTKIPLIGESGEVLGLLGVSEDVTERRAAMERTERLRHAQKLEAIGQLAGGVAHDFNNIVLAIQLQLELLEAEHALAPQVSAVVRDVRASANRAANVARQLLLFGRRQSLRVTRSDLNVVVGNLLNMLTPMIGKRIDVRFDRASAPVFVDGDVGMLEQVITNLCINARDALGGDGTITIRTARVEIDNATASARPHGAEGSFARLDVCDTGCGISPEVQQRIFEPFFTTKPPGEGTGLGLSTSHGIVVQHGGWIEISSEVDRESTFSVFLPVARAGSAPESSPPPEGPERQPLFRAAPGTIEVLVVGDAQSEACRVAARALRKLGYTVFEARDAREAVGVATNRSETLALVVTDASVPGAQSGIDLGHRLRAISRTLGVVLLSDYLQTTDGGGLDGLRVVVKPFTLSALSRVVHELTAAESCGA